jgi:glucose/arabinose dehydrogenase
MKSILRIFIFTLIVVQFHHAQNLELELFATNLNRPVGIKHAGDDKLYVVEQEGFISIVNNDGNVNSTPFLNINDRVINLNSTDERGLLGLAFHPNFSSNGYFYVNYIANNGDTVISRFSRDETNPLLADSNSEFIILSFSQPYNNHNAGDMAFGADGFLYIASGDGGSGGDPQNFAQNTLSLLGKILRIDVNSTTPAHNYNIPDTNPFIGNPNFRGEIWAYGLRNPWKFSFDRLNNDMWIADVGQGDYEEINLATTNEALTGLNYGWRCYESNAPFNTNDCEDPSTYTFPVADYNHFNDGAFKCSITGGYRYRGTDYPGFNGWYFFADWCSQEIGYLVYNETTMNWDITFKQFSGQWVAFGEDINGEIYISDITSGSIYKLKDTTLNVDDRLLTSISIYPNPTKDILNINFGTNANIDPHTEISIYNLQGKKVKTILKNSETIQKINASTLSEGIYILRIDLKNGEQSTHKLVIN